MKMLGSWYPILEPYVDWDNLKNIQQHLSTRGTQILPSGTEVFNAFKLCPPEKTKVVILGQDPYHTPGVAHGLAFSSKRGTPQSLRYIFKALKHDGVTRNKSDLTDWATQGVLLLNTVLTVDAGKANSHKEIGWEQFTRSVVSAISIKLDPVVFMLWGNQAKSYSKEIMPFGDNLILKAPHPVAEVYQGNKAGFINCGHFKKANNYLKKQGLSPIKW